MRAVTSIVMLLSFVVVTVTGLSMMFAEEHHGGPPPVGTMGGPAGAPPGEMGTPPGAPPGEGRREEGRPGGEGRPRGLFPKPLHELSSLVLVLASVFHLALNGKCLLSYCGLRRKPRAAS